MCVCVCVCVCIICVIISSSVKPVDKREGAGAHNWGSMKDDIENTPYVSIYIDRAMSIAPYACNLFIVTWGIFCSKVLPYSYHVIYL